MTKNKIINFENNYSYILWLEVVVWCGVVFYLSGIPNLKIESFGILDFILRKIAHFTEFGILAILLYRAINNPEKVGRIGSKEFIFWPIFLTFVYAVLDEFHQYFVPGRITSAIDVTIDTCGAISGLLIFKFSKKYKYKNLIIKT